MNNIPKKQRPTLMIDVLYGFFALSGLVITFVFSTRPMPDMGPAAQMVWVIAALSLVGSFLLPPILTNMSSRALQKNPTADASARIKGLLSVEYIQRAAMCEAAALMTLLSVSHGGLPMTAPVLGLFWLALFFHRPSSHGFELRLKELSPKFPAG